MRDGEDDGDVVVVMFVAVLSGGLRMFGSGVDVGLMVGKRVEDEIEEPEDGE